MDIRKYLWIYQNSRIHLMDTRTSMRRVWILYLLNGTGNEGLVFIFMGIHCHSTLHFGSKNNLLK